MSQFTPTLPALELGIFEEQKENLIKVASYLWERRAIVNLKMEHYNDDAPGYNDAVIDGTHICGTSACAVGHGPQAGVEIQGFETWRAYESRAFGIEHGSAAWYFLFGPGHRDCPISAVARIEEFLTNGHQIFNTSSAAFGEILRDDQIPTYKPSIELL